MNDSMAASAGPVPPIWNPVPGFFTLLDALVISRMTPEPRSTMCRAAARAVTKLERAPAEIGRRKSSTSMSSRGVP